MVGGDYIYRSIADMPGKIERYCVASFVAGFTRKAIFTVMPMGGETK